MSEVKVNKVSPRSGTTVTIGDSGDTINLVGTLQNNGSPLAGDISSVVAGTGLSGGATSGVATLNIEAAQPTITSIGGALAVLTCPGNLTVTGNAIASAISATNEIRAGSFQSSDGDNLISISGTSVSIGTTGDKITNFTSTGIDDNADALAMTITSAENIGIGETTPLGKLHVKTADTGASAVSGNANELVIENTGNVGITLQSANDGVGNIYFGDVANGSIGRVSYDHTSNFMSFNTNGNERMRIDSSGSVGIGTSTPQTIFHILQTAETIDNGIKIVGSSSPVSGRIYMNSTDIHIDNATAGQNSGITLNTSGKTGIGTASPSSKLSMFGSDTTAYSASSVGGQDSGSTLKIQNNSNAANTFASIDFNTNNNRVINRIVSSHGNSTVDGFLSFITEGSGTPAERMRIDHAGSLGLGTTAPFNSRPGSFTISNEAPTIYMEDTNGSGSKVGQLLYQDAVLTYSIGSRNGTGTTNSTELFKIINSGKIFTKQTAQFNDCVTIGGSPFIGDFQIEVSGLTAVTGNAHKSIGMRLSYRGIAGDASNGQNKDVLIFINGLSSWSSVGGIDTGGGTVAISVNSATTTAVTFTVTSPASTCVGAYVATLFANDNSTMECGV